MIKLKKYKTCKFTSGSYHCWEYKVCSGEDEKEEKRACILMKLIKKNKIIGLSLREWKYFKHQNFMYHISGMEMRELSKW
jgi:hypothetical protein